MSRPPSILIASLLVVFMASDRRGGGKLKACCTRICGLMRNLLTLSIPTFFLWSGLVYLATTAIVFVMRQNVHDFLCHIHTPPGQCKENCGSSDIVMCPKSDCWRNALNLTILEKATGIADPLYNDMHAASGSWHCLNSGKLESSTSPAKMIAELALRNAAESEALDIKVTQKCISFHCAVLQTALTHPDLVYRPKSDIATGCTNRRDVKQAANAAKCTCSQLYQSMTDSDWTNYQAQTLCNLPLITTMTTTTTTSTIANAAGGGASVRRLQIVGETGDRMKSATSAGSDCTGPAGCSAPSIQNAGEDVTPIVWERERRLDHTPTAPPAVSAEQNDKLPEYSVGEWSKCTCYQGCMPGLQIRVVQCQSPPCKTPTPQVAKKCECEPCTNCNVMFNTLVVMATSTGNGVISLLVWLGIVYMNSIPENHLVRLSWGQWFLGMFVKRLPTLVRLCVFVNIGLAIFLVLQAFMPQEIAKFQTDCHNVPSLKVMVIFFACVMLFQVLLGVLAKYFNRMYPYLFRPVRDNTPAPVRLVNKIFRSLGP